jgi:hypothetical protein
VASLLLESALFVINQSAESMKIGKLLRIELRGTSMSAYLTSTQIDDIIDIVVDDCYVYGDCMDDPKVDVRSRHNTEKRIREYLEESQ